MISLMNTHLNGEPALQRMILMYCLDSPCAKVVQDLVKSVIETTTNVISGNTTLWCLMGPIPKTRRLTKCIQNVKPTFYTFIVCQELELTRIEDPNVYKNRLTHLQGMKSTEFSLMYRDLTSKEIHGTPSGIQMRRHLEHLNKRGFVFRDHETLWSRFVCLRGRVCERRGLPKLVLTPSVNSDFCVIYDYYHEEVMKIVREKERRQEEEFQKKVKKVMDDFLAYDEDKKRQQNIV